MAVVRKCSRQKTGSLLRHRPEWNPIDFSLRIERNRHPCVLIVVDCIPCIPLGILTGAEPKAIRQIDCVVSELALRGGDSRIFRLPDSAVALERFAKGARFGLC